MINENAGQLIAQCFMQQDSRYGTVNATGQATDNLAVANLRGVDEEQLATGLQHASHLLRRVPPRLLGHLVEKVHVGHRVEGTIL